MKLSRQDFATAWETALEQIIWPWNNESRRDWKTVLASQQELWRACYEDSGEPIDVDRLLDTLVYERDFEDQAAA